MLLTLTQYKCLILTSMLEFRCEWKVKFKEFQSFVLILVYQWKELFVN